MKLFFAIILLIISGAIGYYFSNKLVKRREMYETMREFNQAVKSEALFSQNSITKIINKYADGKDFYKLINNYTSIEKSTYSVKYLKKSELEFIKNYSLNVGRGNVESVIKYLNENEMIISNYLYEAKENEKKYKTLYLKMGILIGLILFILLL